MGRSCKYWFLGILCSITFMVLAGPIHFLSPAPTYAAVPNGAEIISPTIVSGDLPNTSIVFVSRNRQGTWRKVHIGPTVDVVGRELTPGGRLLRWDPDGTIKDLTEDTGIYDVQQPDVSFDGTQVAFSAVTEPEGRWHLWEMGIDGAGLRQLTFDDRPVPIPPDPENPGRNERVFGRYGDFGPAYLPDGRIIFASTRYMTLSGSCGQRGQNLYVLDPDTGVSARRTTERAGAMDPYVLTDGRVVFSHWIDAVNRPADQGDGLRPLETDYNFSGSNWGIWIMNPDASGAERYAFIKGGLTDSLGAHQPHALADNDLVVAVRANGSLLGDTLASAVTRITPGFTEPKVLRFLGNPFEFEADHALAPAPLPDGGIVVSYTVDAVVTTDDNGIRSARVDFGLYVADDNLNTLVSLYNDPDTDELDPAVITPRSAPIIQDGPGADRITDDPTIDLGTTATLVNHNVYADLPVDAVFLPSPKIGTVAYIDIYDDAQTFITSDEFPLLRKQMPRKVGRFPVADNGSFVATVPADKPLLFVLMDKDGVTVRSPMSLKHRDGRGYSLPHSFNGHDYLRPDTEIHCAGCHKGHMIQHEPAKDARTNLSRLATAAASSEPMPFFGGAWRAADLRLNSQNGAYAWATFEGEGAWLELRWPTAVNTDEILIYPLAVAGAEMDSASLTLSDNTEIELKDLPSDGSPVRVALAPGHVVSWVRFTVERSHTPLVGLAEMVVNGPPETAIMADTPPPPPVNLRATEGVVSLQWDQTPNRSVAPSVAGYRVYYGTAPGAFTDFVDVGNVTRFIMRDLLQDGHTYYMALKSYNIYKTESESYSNEVASTVRAPVILGVSPESGPVGGGTPITITGENFARRGVQVKIGGDHARNVVVVNAETITAVTPWHGPGPVEVKVINPDNREDTKSEAFRYTAPFFTATTAEASLPVDTY